MTGSGEAKHGPLLVPSLAEEPHVTAMSLTKEADFLGQSSSHFGIPA